jgi:bla regulator protein blaR1
MYLLTLEEWVTTVLVRALGWTFTHSLWQALMALLAAYAILAVMKKAKASSRYNLLVGISLVFISAVVFTFIMQLRQNDAVVQLADGNSSLQRILHNGNGAATSVILESKRILDVMLDYFNQYLYILVTSWFIIFSVKWLRLSLNLNYVNRISRFESAPANAEWQQMNERLKNSLGIRKEVKLMHSNIVNVPLVSGIFRPLILVPAGMLSNMPADVIESILLHELGHIKRHDYLVNIIQSAVETIFFFNPFIVKLSAMIREEREACCDAIAVDVTNNKMSYVQALVTFGQYSSTSAPLLAFAGSKNHLLQRVTRILYNQNKKPGFMEKSILFGSVIMLSVITAFTTIKNEKKLAAPFTQEIKTYVNDTIPESVNENKNSDQDEPTKAESRKRKKKMRDAEQKMEKKEKELAEMEEKMEQIQIQIDKDIQLKNDLIQTKMIDVQNRINLQNEKFQAKQELQLAQAQMVMANIDMEKINRDVQKALAKVDMEKINREIQATTLKAIEQKKQIAALSYGRGYMNDDIESILEFLEENNVADEDDVKSFTLNNDDLIVNDKKQDASLHQRLKERYIKSKDDRILYSNSNGTKSITITTNDPS